MKTPTISFTQCPSLKRGCLIRLHARTANMSVTADPEFDKVNIRTLCATIIIKSLNYDPLAKRVHQHFRNVHYFHVQYLPALMRLHFECVNTHHVSDIQSWCLCSNEYHQIANHIDREFYVESLVIDKSLWKDKNEITK